MKELIVRWALQVERSISSWVRFPSAGLQLAMDAPCEEPRLSPLEQLNELWDGLLMAVPKRRTTHRVKRLRMTHKWPQLKQSFVSCAACNQKHLPHHLCPWCFPFNKWTINKDKGKPKKREGEE